MSAETFGDVRQLEADRQVELEAEVQRRIFGNRVRVTDEIGIDRMFKLAEWFVPNAQIRGYLADWNRVPAYLADASADYEVLEHVRKTWDSAQLLWMAEFLVSMWDERKRAAGLSLVLPVTLCYEPGDYARAALAALEARTA